MTVFRGFTSFPILVIFSLVLAVNTVCSSADVREIGDAIIIDAKPNVEIKSRGGRQNFRIIQPNWSSYFQYTPNKKTAGDFLPISENPSSTPQQQNPQQDGQCVSKVGVPGVCLPFEECYPLRNPVPYQIKVGGSVDSEHIRDNLNDEIWENSQNGICSSVVHAGNSTTNNICCQQSNPKSFDSFKKNVPFINSLFADPFIHSVHNNVQSDIFLQARSCGQRFAADIRIVNGSDTVPGELPWMVAIFGKSGKQTCGGTLISENVVLTAAHCIASYGAQDLPRIKVFIGDWNIRSTSDGPHEVRSVKRLIKHKYFNMQSFVNDIALLRLNQPVTLSPRIQPICLPSGPVKSLVNQKLTVAGWGRTSLKGPASPTLKKVNVRVWSNAACANVYRGTAPGGILSSMICAGDKGLDSCVGDSGGPLFDSSSFQQIGIVSFGKGCATYPGVYTRVSEFIPWITANIDK